MATLSEIRQQYPQYNDMSDQQLADAMYTKHYADMPRDVFNEKIGYGGTGSAKRNADGTYGSPPEGMVLNSTTGEMEDLRSPINPNIPQGTANAAALGAGQGAGFGLMNRAAAAATVPFGGDYNYNKARMDEAERRAKEDHPIAYYGGNFAGGAATASALAPVSLTGRAVEAGAGRLATAAASAADGGLYGAAYGSAEGDNIHDRLMNGLKGAGGGAIVGAAAPALVSGVSNAVRRAVTPFTSSPERQAAVDYLTQEGVPLTAGQKTGNKKLGFAEAELGGGTAQGVMDDQSRAFTDAAMRKAGGSGLASPNNLGALQQKLSNGFKEISARNTLTLDKDMVNDFSKTIERYGTKIDALKKPVFDRVRQDAINEFLKNNGSVSGTWYQQARSDLSKMARSAQGNDEMLSGAYRGLRDALDDGMGRSIQKTNPSDTGVWEQLRKYWGNFKVVADASRGAGEMGGQGFISPARLAQAAVKGKNGLAFATGKSDFTDLVKAGQAAMAPLPNSGTASRMSAKNLGANLLGGLGAFLGSHNGGAETALAGAMAGAALPHAAGRVLMSSPVQKYLVNRVVPGSLSPQMRGEITNLVNNQIGGSADKFMPWR